MARVLVLYATHFGQTRKIAEHIADRLRERGHEVELGDARYGLRGLPPPQDYDVAVLGSCVEMGHHASELRAYIREHVDALNRMPSAFFSVSTAAARPDATADPDGYMDTLFADVGWSPTQAVAFAGGLPYRKYNWLLRFIMKRISRSAGLTTDTSRDHELTDWRRVDQFTDQLAAIVHGPRPAKPEHLQPR